MRSKATKTLDCHKCKDYQTEKCLSCKKKDENTSHKQYIIDGYDVPQHDTSGSEQVTNLPDEVENKMRIFLCNLFALDFNELMCLKSIMNNMTLTDYAQDMEALAQDNKCFSRFRAFQTRKRLLKKLGDEYSSALLTMGQKKPLKA